MHYAAIHEFTGNGDHPKGWSMEEEGLWAGVRGGSREKCVFLMSGTLPSHRSLIQENYEIQLAADLKNV